MVDMSSDTALFWDESFLWALVSYKSLRCLGAGFSLVSSEDIRAGRLNEFKALFVPGGWASNKMRALGRDGAEGIRRFVASGGSYIGICGGAGLATADGLGLLDIRRKPLKQRVPSLSGRIQIKTEGHPLWEGLKEPLFTIWWPSQFVIEEGGMRTLASFEQASDDAFSSDLNVGDMKSCGWETIEKAYDINLNPERMEGDPLVVEGLYGRGKVFASLLHFDTPGDENGELVLRNLWKHLGLVLGTSRILKDIPPTGALYNVVEDLFEFGKRNFLWFERSPFIQWRRGIRGWEYYTLFRMVRELAVLYGGDIDETGGLAEDVRDFVSKAGRLLKLERQALQRGEAITFSKTSDSEIKVLRSRMFSESKSYGGLFKSIIDRIDTLIFKRLRDVHAGN